VSSVFTFDEKPLDGLLSRHGLQQTWKNILRTHVSNSGSRFDYMLKDDFFEGAELLEFDMLSGLTIGQIGVLYEYSVATTDVNSLMENGQYFTPDDVAQFMAEKAKHFPEGVWLDPCAGIGNLSWHLVNSQPDKEQFLISSMILSDQDGLALQIGRAIFTLSFQKENSSLYFDIKPNFRVFDFLSVADDGRVGLFGPSHAGEIPRHDFVIVNPPYKALLEADHRFETSQAKDLYAYFLENVVKSSQGFVSITPQSFTNAKKFAPLRRLLLRYFPSLTIFNFDNIPGNIFFGVKHGSSNTNKANSTRIAIMIAGQGENRKRITSLLRWRTSERAQLLSSTERFLSEPKFTEDFFPKVSSVFSDLYEVSQNYRTLGEITSNTAGNTLFLPAAPRYFISALMEPVARASMKVLHFRSEEDANRAYLILNSSYMYWWWRVRDGGMTLALETIKSLPVPPFDIDYRLLEELKKSERVNRVFKKNAGAMQENVKHPQDLVLKLNFLIVSQYADRLALTHLNSDLPQIDKFDA
jgi:hypothetical protein